MSEPKDYITLAEEYASTKYSSGNCFRWEKVRDAVIHGYLLRAYEEKESVEKLHEEIAELKKQLNKAQDPYAE